MVWRANSRRVISIRIATPPKLASVSRRGPRGRVPIRTETSQPSPARSGGRYIHFCFIATARSSGIRVPKNPEIIKGPCAIAREEVNAGSCHPSRINPAQSAASNARIASNRNGKGKRLGNDLMTSFYRLLHDLLNILGSISVKIYVIITLELSAALLKTIYILELNNGIIYENQSCEYNFILRKMAGNS